MSYRLLLILIVFSGCIKGVKLPVRETKPILVVEGLLLTDSTPCKVSLSYSGTYNNAGYYEMNIITDAQVFLRNDTGDSILLNNEGNGDYVDESISMLAKAGHSYELKIYLANGERYASLPEKILPVPKEFSIDTVGISYPFNNDALHAANVLIRTQDPPAETNYYRWTATAWIPRKATGIPCGIGGSYCKQYCYQYYEDHYINILSDQKVNGNEIRFQRAYTSPFYWWGKHFAEIKQLSITKEAYQFWQSYKDQTGRTGGILDPLPSSIPGNIYNVDKPKELALGYFEASDAVSKKIKIVPLFIYNIVVEIPAQPFIAVGACDEVFPNAMEEAPKGWENAGEYRMDIKFF